MRVVIDTNILIGGADDENSHSFKIIKEVIDGRLRAFVTHQTMKENKLLLRKSVKDWEYKELLSEYFRRLKIVRRKVKLDVVGDKEDNKLFESAVSSGAKYLITSDREVLDIGEYEGVEVINPERFWTRYQNEGDSGSIWSEWAKMVLGS